jgi:hypothetical protein
MTADMSTPARLNPKPAAQALKVLQHSPVGLLLVSIVALGGVAVLDALTPVELGFSAFYVVPVLIAAWGLGTSRGLAFALLAACTWYCVDLTSGRTLPHEFYRAWDTFNHLVSYSLAAIFTGSLKAAWLREQGLREDRDRALQNVRELEGLLPVCAWCKKVRDDQGYWQELEAYLRPRTRASFSHGICPSCADSLVSKDREN